VEAAYSGNQTRRFSAGSAVGGVGASLNVLPVDQLGRPDTYYTAAVPNPLAGLLPLNPTLNGPTIQRQRLLVDFPQYSSIGMSELPLGRSSYHSAQFRLTKRYSQGLTLNVSYTISKNLEAITFLNPQDFNLKDINASRLEQVLTLYDAPQKLAVLWTYELPFGKGKRFGAGAPGPLSKILSGWLLNLDATLQSGFPVNFPDAAPLTARSAKLPASERNIRRAFDTSLWDDPATGRRVSAQSPFLLRNFPSRFPDVRRYPLKNLDCGISKKTAISERVSFEIRGELYNVANHPWFSEVDSQLTRVASGRFGWLEQRPRNNARIVALAGKIRW